MMRDATTMLRRNLRRTIRYPAAAASTVLLPVIFLLLFVFVFGDTMGAGLAGGGRAEYLDYITPAIFLLAVAGASQGAAISVALDMQEGIVNRFRTMSISRASVLTGHVAANLLTTMAAIVVVIGIALALGFSPAASAADWAAAFGLLTLSAFAVIWLSTALGMVTKSVETASNLPMPLFLLPFLGSGFVPADSMSGGLQWFAEYQPFTPIMDTLRGLLLGTAIGSDGVLAVLWCLAIALVGYLWAKRLYERDPTP
jgi:ABC-2 type transport system permease protein